MSLPRPRRRPRPGIPLLLAGLILAFTGTAAGVDLRSGSLLVADRTADPFGAGDSRGSLFLVDPTSQVMVRLLASPDGFVDPHSVLPLGDGRILVADANARLPGDILGRGAVWIIDPSVALPGEAVVFASSFQWVNPIDLLEEPSGNILLLDDDADPLSIGNRPGALFRIHRITRQVTAVASSPQWVDPSSMVYDIDGSLLIWDRRADPRGLGGFPGALFRVQPGTGVVELVFSIGAFRTPVAVAIDRAGDYLILDQDANPAGHDGDPGGVFRVDRDDLSVEPLFFPPDFLDPIDLHVDPSGDIWVADSRANPLQFPTARGAVFRCDPSSGRIERQITSGFFRDLTGIVQFAGTALDSSVVAWEDLSGPPLQPGDRMRVVVRPRNTGTVPGRPVTMEHRLGNLWDFRLGSATSSSGAVGYDPARRSVLWTGDLEVQEEAEIRYEIRLSDAAGAGMTLTETVDLSVSRMTSSFELRGDVAFRSGPARFVWADYRPAQPTNQGRILEMPPGALVPSVVYEGPPLVQPDDVVLLPDGRIAVLDRRSLPLGPGGTPGGIYRIDPLDGSIDTLLAVGDYPELRFPVGLAGADAGTLLLIDKDANPLGLPGLPGAVFSFDIESGRLELIASDERFREPADAILESSGKILLVDYDADPFGTNPRGGAVFEIDPSTGAVAAIPDPNRWFVDPIGLAEGGGRRVYVADLSADPLGLGRNTGAIFEINRAFGDVILLASADSFYVDPTDVLPREDGRLIVTDREANPFDLPPRDRGAVFHVRPRIERPRIVAADPSMYGPEAVAGVVRGSLSSIELAAVELGEPPTGGGDTLRFEAAIRNTGRAPVPEALATIVLGPSLALIGAEGPGEVSADPAAGAVSWLGPVPVAETVRFAALARVGEGLEFGDRVFALLDVSGPGAGAPDSAVVGVVAPLRPGDLILVDRNADPNHLGDGDGALYLLDGIAGRAKHLLQTDPIWVDPTAIVHDAEGSFLLADTRRAEPGIVYRADYLQGSVEPYIEDPRLGSPIDLFRGRDGALYVVDPYSNVDPQNPRKAAVFVQRGEAAPLSVLTDDPILAEPSEMAEDEFGRLWLIDRRADPNAGEPGRGALFQIDPATGAILDTLQFPELVAPSSIVSLTQSGLLIVDGITRAAGTSGALFRFDPEGGTLAVAVADPRFRQPHRATVTPSGEVWITDLLARDESLPGNPRTLFRWDPESGRLDAAGGHAGYVTPWDLLAMPGPNPVLSSYWLEDRNGAPLDPGDEIVLHARVENVGPLPTLAAVFSDTLPVVVRLDAASVRAEAGIVEFPVGLNGLKWTVDLPPSTAREIQYGAVVHSGTLQGTRMRFSSHLDTNEGIRRSRSFGARVPVYFEDGFLYLADFDADPMELGGRPGTLWKVQLTNGLATAMISSSRMVTPIDTVLMPATDPVILIVDADANPRKHPYARGAVWRCVPETGDVELVAADTTFRSPRAAVAISSTEILMVDARADPFDLRQGLGPGAVYRIDVTTGEVEPFASDPALFGPVGLVLDGMGGVYVIDPDADPMNFGLRNGAVFRLDLAEREFSVFAASADFRRPVDGVLGSDGLLYLLDRDVTVFPNTEARGAVYRIDGLGNAEREGASRAFRRPHAIALDHQGRLIVSDSEADPRGRGTDTGAVFRRERLEQEFRILSAFSRFVSPAGFFVQDDLTPIEVTGLNAIESEGGIRIEWEVVAAAFDLFYCLRADGPDPDPVSYRILNQEDPVPGEGPWIFHDRAVEPGALYSYLILGFLSGGGERRFGPVTATAPRALRFALLPPAPHPSRGETTLRFDLPAAGAVRLEIYDLAGRRVRLFEREDLPAGSHGLVWDGRNRNGHPVASGVYWMRLTWAGREARGRLVLLR